MDGLMVNGWKCAGRTQCPTVPMGGGPSTTSSTARRVSTLLWRKCLDAGDFDGKSFAAKVADCSVGGLRVAVSQGGSDGGGDALNVGLVPGLGADDGESVHRLYG